MNQEQLDEIEALQAIYGEGIDMIDGHTFDILIEPYPGESNEIQVRLRIAYSQGYPLELPFYAFKTVKGLTDPELDLLIKHARSLMDRDIGSPMVFDVIEGVKDWLQTLHQTQAAAALIEVPLVPKHATYTPVTVESFEAWKSAFFREQQEREMQEKEAIQGLMCMNGLTHAEVWSKPSGREMFERQNWTRMEAEEVAEEDVKDEEEEEYEEELELPDQEELD